jgi:His/Glu/Gln/Arg/opine family amino acid ABC transporter permease subunit
MVTLPDWSVVLEDPGRSQLLHGLLITIQLAIYGIIGSTILGVLVAIARTTRSRALWPLRALAAAYTEFLRNIPILVHIVFWGYGVFSIPAVRAFFSPLSGVYSDIFIAAVFALSFYQSTYIAEALRSGLQSIPKGQSEAARASGLSNYQVFRFVIFPQVIRVVLPAVGSQYVGVTKNTSVVLFIGVADVVFEAQGIESQTFEAFAAFGAAIVLIAALCIVEGAILSAIQRRITWRHGVSLLGR